MATPAREIAPQPANDFNGKPQPQRLNSRQIIFRCVRLTLAGVLVSSAAMYARTAFSTARSELAYINAEITPLRAPIAGQVRLESFNSGRTLRAGAPLFTIENARFGNEHAVSHLNWVTELAERLQAEADEAAVRFRRQQEITRVQERLFSEQIASRMELVEERAKLDLAGTVLTNKLALAKKSAERVEQLSRQVQLQQTASVQMPFEGVAWAIPAKNGGQIALNETVIELINPNQLWIDAYFHERHAVKLEVGAEVTITTPQGETIGRGRVDSTRAGVGRIPFDGVAAVSPNEHTRRRIAVRIRLASRTRFEAGQFFGVGRSVIVTLNAHE